ncbi:hypothetical protein ACS0TY_008441 [Phlomoides rotata]
MDPFRILMGYDVDKVRIVRGRGSWSKIEEDALIQCLNDVVHEGWKVKNGFKAGFQRELEKGLRKILCGTDIVDPYVKGLRYKMWPYYPHWIEIFWKDRATGENDVDPIDLVNELYRNEMEQEGETGEKYVPLTPEGMQDK